MLFTSVAWLLFRMILISGSYILPPVTEVVPFCSFYISSLLIVITFSSNYLSTSLKRHHNFVTFGMSYTEKHEKETYTDKKTRCFCQAFSAKHFQFQQRKTQPFKPTYFFPIYF